MPLKDAEIRALKPSDTPYRRSDEKGLYIEVTPSGSRLWRMKFRHLGKEGRIAFGAYPEVTLAQARRLRDDARKLLQQGINPAQERQKAKRTARMEADNSFASIADEVLAKMEREHKSAATVNKQRWFLSFLNPAVGNRPITDIEPAELLLPLRKLERKGHHETAIRTRALASRIFLYAVATGRAKSNPAALLRGALTTPRVKHHAAILDAAGFGELLRAIDQFSGQATTQLALKIAPHVYVRPGELRQAEWSEFDLIEAVWRIPAAKMKLRRVHAVPLSKQVLAYLRELEALTGGGKYLFPSMQTLHKPMSENTINQALRRMGFGPDRITGHGLRSTASTLLNESGQWNPDAIERALAHGDSDMVRGSYHRGTYWEERVRMAQWWSDWIDAMKNGAQIIELPGATKTNSG